jgi:CspA family cold shock protein
LSRSALSGVRLAYRRSLSDAQLVDVRLAIERASLYGCPCDGIPSVEAHCLTTDSLCARLVEAAELPKLIDSVGGGRACARPQSDATGEIMTIGTVKFFNTSKGFGFIAPDGGGKDVFVHATALEAAGLRSLAEGQRVSFDIQPDARGSKAANLKLA